MENSYIIKEFKGQDPYFENYKPLVLATWLRGLKHGCDFFSMTDSKAFFSVYSKVILNLIKRPECVVRVAVLSDDPDIAVGWSVFEGGVVHFVYVRPEGRRHGIGSSLLPKKFDTISHITKVGKAIWKKKFQHVIFNPF